MTKPFQNDTNAVGDLRAIVENRISKYAEAELRLGSSADIIVHSLFEYSVAKFKMETSVH